MGKLLKFVAYCGLMIAAAAIGVFGWLAATAVSAADLPPLKNGDLVFQNTRGSQGLAIMLASRSAYSHMGMIELDADGQPWVIEAVGPVQTIKLDEWLKRGTGGRITIKRIDGLEDADAAAAIKRAHRYDGLPYDIFFLPGRDRIYCSELVNAAFAEGAKIELGQVQRVRDLKIDNGAVRRLIESRWRRHPLCQTDQTKTFEACYAVILDQTLVTPVSIARDPKVKLVYSNFGLMTD